MRQQRFVANMSSAYDHTQHMLHSSETHLNRNLNDIKMLPASGRTSLYRTISQPVRVATISRCTHRGGGQSSSTLSGVFRKPIGPRVPDHFGVKILRDSYLSKVRRSRNRPSSLWVSSKYVSRLRHFACAWFSPSNL